MSAGGDNPQAGRTGSAAIALESSGKRGRRFKFETRMQVIALIAGLPAVLIALLCLWKIEFSTGARVTLGGVILCFWLGGSVILKDALCYPLRTISNLLGALAEGDYSMKGTAGQRDDVLGEVTREVNVLSDLLRGERVGAREEGALLQKILAEIDVAVFAFDASGKLRLANQRGARLLRMEEPEALGRSAEELGLSGLLEGPGDQVVELSLPGGSGRWKVHIGHYREGGQPRRLLILTDLTRALRAEERAAWKRLIQILRHEINNSLAPISSIAGSLRGMQRAQPRNADWEEDLAQGLEIIENRSESLHRFILAYSEVTRLPEPQFGPVDAGERIRRAAGLDDRRPVKVEEGPPLVIQADGDQLDQLLINLLRNAIEAVEEGGGEVRIGWEADTEMLRIWVEDDGPGIEDADKAFTPFYSTKPEGGGIGLPLCRQIAENHGGTLSLANRSDGRGCRVALVLPIADR